MSGHVSGVHFHGSGGSPTSWAQGASGTSGAHPLPNFCGAQLCGHSCGLGPECPCGKPGDLNGPWVSAPSTHDAESRPRDGLWLCGG